jgi:hypothetical protein
MKLEFSRQSFEKHARIKFQKILPVTAEFVHADGQTDGHDETNSRFS